MAQSTPTSASPREDTLQFLRAFARTFDRPDRTEAEARCAAKLLAGALHGGTC